MSRGVAGPIGSAGLRKWVSDGGEREGAKGLPTSSCAAAVTAANEPIKSQQIMLHVRHDFIGMMSRGGKGQWAATVAEHA